MIPKTLDQAIIQLIKQNKIITAAFIDFKLLAEQDIYEFHHTIGRDIRNEWKLWSQKAPLNKHFFELGISHADDMSSIILTTLHRVLNRKPVRLKEQIKHYQDYWNNRIYSYSTPAESGLEWLGI